MTKSLKIRMANFLARYKQEVIAFIIIFLSSFYIFSGILDGKVISNAHNIYYFEPWVYYKESADWTGNLILSDLIDGYTNRFDINEKLQNGEFPVWHYGNKLGNLGVTNFLGSFYYPFRLVPWIIFGVPIGWTIETIIKFVLGGFFMYLLLRKFKVSNWVSLLVGVGYMYGGAQLAESQTEYSTVTLTAPIVFYFLERFFQSSTWRNSLWLMLSLVLFITTTFVSIIFFFSFWLSLYSILRLIFTIENKREVILKLLVTVFFFVLISSVGLISTAEFFGNESGIDLDYRESYGLRQAHVFGSLTLIASHIFGHGFLDSPQWKYGSYVNLTIFIGYLTFLSVFTGGILRLIKKRERTTIIITFLTILLFFEIYEFSFEKLESITNKLPLFHGNPAMYQKSVLQFMLAILGGLGLDYIMKNNFTKKLKEGIFLSVFSTIITFISIWALQHFFDLSEDPSDFYEKYVNRSRILIILIWLCFNLLVFKDWFFPMLQNFLSDWISRSFNKDAEGLKLFISLISALLLIFYLYEAKLNVTDWIPYAKASHWFPQTEVTDYLYENLNDSRVLPIGVGVAVPATLEAYGFPVVAGRLPVPDPYRVLLQNAYPKAYVDHPTQVIFKHNETDLAAVIWDLVDLKYFVASRQINKEELKNKYGEEINIIELKDSTLIENTTRPGHAWLVNDGVVFDNPQEIAEATKENWDIYEDVAFLSDEYLRDEDERINEDIENVQGEILEYNQDTNKMTIKLRNEEPAYLIISSSFFPGWEAEINGEDTDIIPAYGFLKAIQIPESGEHTIELKFRPKGLVYGGIISSLGIVVAIGFYTYMIRRERKSN